MNPNDTYTSPLASRNASPEMLRIWSPRHKFNTWRRIWLAIAEAQHDVTKDRGSERAATVRERSGESPDDPENTTPNPLPRGRGSSDGPLVTEEQLEELRAVVERGITDEELARAAELERDLRHDVMAHVHCLGESCPKARPIVHLGCTSQDVVCNADILAIQDATDLLDKKAIAVVVAISDTAKRWKSLATLGFTHYQPAQPVTVGRRLAQYAYELQLASSDLCNRRYCHLHLRGLRGATGTQASFLNLFQNDSTLVDNFEHRFTEQLRPNEKSGGNVAYRLTTQTYPRVTDARILADLASIAAVLHKIATDIRLLSNRKEVDEPFGDKQIGSSAMPYKRNPMKCERICGLTRFAMNLVGNAYDTAATQWLERTLDDSSNRRLSLPEAFLALDGALDLMHQVVAGGGGLVVHEAMVRKNLMAELPFLATENILMEAVKLGGDRQDLHEKIRVHAQAAGMRVKQEGLDNDLIDRLRADPAFEKVHHLLTEDQLLDPMNYVGRAVEQTERFLKDVIEPLRERYKDDLETLEATDRGV